MDEELEKYATEVEMQIYREYRDVFGLFRFAVETERRFYLTNSVNLVELGDGRGREIEMEDAWVWDMHRPARFIKRVKVITDRDINIEELEHSGPV